MTKTKTTREAQAISAKDVTTHFHSLHKQVRQNGPAATSLPANLLRKTVLFTPGFLARHMGNYAKHLLARIEQMGLNVQPIKVDTDTSTRQNVELIKTHIRKLGYGEGILIGHSRGGVMNLDAYRQLTEADKAKISRIILIQSPINGSPVADFMIVSDLMTKALAPIGRLILGNDVNDTLQKLTTRYRAREELTLPPLTAADLDKIVTLRSIIERGQSTTFEPARLINQRYGHKSDGLVPYSLSEIPGTRDVTLMDYDHAHPVLQEPTFGRRLMLYRPNKKFTSGDVIESLLYLAYLDS